MASIHELTRETTHEVTNEVTQVSTAAGTELATFAESWKSPENLSGLCSACWNMTANEEQFLRLLSGRSLSRSWNELNAWGQAPCPICAFISVWCMQSEGPIDFWPVIAEGRLDHIQLIHVDRWINRIYLWKSTEHPLLNVLRKRSDFIDPNSREMRDAISKHVRTCLSQHEGCTQAIPPLLPSRVLYIGSSAQELDDCSKLSLRLHVSLPLQRAEYAALSYCWGGAQKVVSTQSTLGSYQEGLNLNFLPQTVQDAIKVTRGLNIQYLWVDALCILQDEASDMTHEIQQMGEIYKNATLTIAAARSRSVEEGFLHTYSCSGAFETRLSNNGNLEKGWLVPKMDPPQEPLAKRGWAFQEQIMSPRILHYGSNGVSWSCSYTEAIPVHSSFFIDAENQLEQVETIQRLKVHLSEQGGMAPGQQAHEGQNRSLSFSSLATPLSQFLRWAKPDWDLPNLDKFSIEKAWRILVEDYCSRDLSFQKDKLLAIAGVAAEIHNLCPDVYLAGLWKSHLIDQLQWRRDQSQNITRQNPPRDFCDVPSWSWASTSGRITFGYPMHCDAHFLATDVRPKFANSPFGDVTGKSLVLSAKLFKVEDQAAPGNELGSIRLDRPSSDRELYLHQHYRELFGPNDEESKNIWYMLLGYSESNPVGLVLCKVQTVFRRIGFFEINYTIETIPKLLKKMRRTRVEII
ncbi:hypothetical protein EG329_005777 [Mollisiaceae sp. DMI_Dod_QoI]|nr:hypothetical protein EG329_005777 [Helotiales sp. DMI_Dod_QoI]